MAVVTNEYDHTLDLGRLCNFDFVKATKVTIVKEVNSCDTVIAECRSDNAQFNKVDNANLIIKIDGKSYHVTEIKEGAK